MARSTTYEGRDGKVIVTYPRGPGTVYDLPQARKILASMRDRGAAYRGLERAILMAGRPVSAAKPLHPGASVRALRREFLRLTESRMEALAAVDDPRMPAGVAVETLNQLDAEISEIHEALGVLEAHWAAKLARDCA